MALINSIAPRLVLGEGALQNRVPVMELKGQSGRKKATRGKRLPKRLGDLIHVYHDLESLITSINKSAIPHSIDVQKLLRQLQTSRRKLERRICNTLLLETRGIKKRLRRIALQFTSSS